MGTLNDCYWLAETRRERLDGGAWFHWSEPLMTRPPGFYPSPPPCFSIRLANADGTDTESYERVRSLELILTDNWERWSALRSAGDRWPEMNQERERERQSVVFVIWRYRGYVKLYTFWDHWLLSSWYESCNWAQRCRYMMYRRHTSTKYNPEHYLEIPNKADACQSYNAEYDTKRDPDEVSATSRYTIGDSNRLSNQHRIKSYQSIWHPTSCTRSVVDRATNFKREEWPYRN